MVVLRWLLKTFSIMAAALGGNWVGGQIRAQLTGQAGDTGSYLFSRLDQQTGLCDGCLAPGERGTAAPGCQR